ncbi:hypothetical protein OXX59_000824 [Metschnikowia pulcherrima]
MDFEEQLEKAEKSPYPSLVGASVKSADDSPHNNYIHPEKYTGTSKRKAGKKSILDTSVGASLDDLISEGALLGSDEDFDRFLDDKGNVRSDAKFSKDKSQDTYSSKNTDAHKPVHESSLKNLIDDEAAVLSPVDSTASDAPQLNAVGTKSLAELEDYSTPNLSEYQIGHQISDHSHLLDSVKSHDLSRLPTAEDTESRSKTNIAYPKAEDTTRVARPSNFRSNSGIATNRLDFGSNVNVAASDSLHTPYFQSDERSSSRSRSRVAFRDQSRERSRSRSASMMTPHLARGDSYKNTHEVTPSKYELPADMKVEEDEEPEDRRSRQSKPTLGDSIAAAEASGSEAESVTRDPSLVTSGDYTNFNADGHDNMLSGKNLYSMRSESSTNYLRSISRSRSRKPTSDIGSHSFVNEKNEANPEELEREGALTTDDPYSQVDDLDNMMKKVLKGSAEKSAANSRNSIRGASAKGISVEAAKKKEARSKLGQDACESEIEKKNHMSLARKDAHDDPIAALEGPAKSENSDTSVTDQDISVSDDGSKGAVNDVSAEEKDQEASGQLRASQAPTLSARDIHATGSKPHEPTTTISNAETDLEISDVANAGVNDVSAEEKNAETREQVLAEKAATMTASDIQVGSHSPGPENAQSEEKNFDDSNISSGGYQDRASKNDVSTQTEKDTPTSSANERQLQLDEEMDQNQSKEIKPDENTDVTSEEEKNKVSSPIIPGPKSSNDDTTKLTDETGDNKSQVAEDSHNLITEIDNIPAGSDGNTTQEVSGTVSEEAEEEFDVSPEELREHLKSLPVYLFTSLAGGMQIITRTNRLATILTANGVKFEYRDLGTDEKAKRLWRREAAGKTLPGVVRGDDFIGDWKYIEEINEEYLLEKVLYENF